MGPVVHTVFGNFSPFPVSFGVGFVIGILRQDAEEMGTSGTPVPFYP
jgi:hypothetical protein